MHAAVLGSTHIILKEGSNGHFMFVCNDDFRQATQVWSSGDHNSGDRDCSKEITEASEVQAPIKDCPKFGAWSVSEISGGDIRVNNDMKMTQTLTLNASGFSFIGKDSGFIIQDGVETHVDISPVLDDVEI